VLWPFEEGYNFCWAVARLVNRTAARRRRLDDQMQACNFHFPSSVARVQPMRLYGAIEKVEAQAGGTVRVHGIATPEPINDQGGNKHCRWARPAWQALPIALLLPFLWREFWYSATCSHPTSVDPPLRDYVSSKPSRPRRLSCNVARAANYRDRCGPQARYWEPRSGACLGYARIAAGAALEENGRASRSPVQWYTATRFKW